MGDRNTERERGGRSGWYPGLLVVTAEWTAEANEREIERCVCVCVCV